MNDRKLMNNQICHDSRPVSVAGGPESRVIDSSGELVVDNEAVAEARPDWGEFRGGETDGNGEYRMPTQEESESFRKRIERMAEIFEGADFQWFLDGAMNISLHLGEQIRAHKDLDMSVFERDLSRLDEYLSKQGFGIFANGDERKTMRRLTGAELAISHEPDLSICKIGQNGKIERSGSEAFNFVDLHVHALDSEGNTLISGGGIVVALPKEYFLPIWKRLPNGKEINLSHPAVVAYHKLHHGRPYDFTDLKRLRPSLSVGDFAMLRESLRKEAEMAAGAVDEILTRMWDSLGETKALAVSRDQGIIEEILWMDPDINGRRDDVRAAAYVKAISSYVSEHSEMTYDDFHRQSILILKLRDRFDVMMKRLDELEMIKKD